MIDLRKVREDMSEYALTKEAIQDIVPKAKMALHLGDWEMVGAAINLLAVHAYHSVITDPEELSQAINSVYLGPDAPSGMITPEKAFRLIHDRPAEYDRPVARESSNCGKKEK